MYFSVVSSRASQYAVFNHTQATQSADSIAQIIYRAIGNVGNQASTGGGVLLEKMKGLAVGESISTDADAFESMNPTSAGAQGKLDPEQLGAYSVIITRLEDSASGAPRYDLNVMSSVDGNRDSVHYVFTYNETSPENDPGDAGDMKLFTATGYLPNDAYINGGYYLTDVFYDTQFTYMGYIGSVVGGQDFIGYNLYTGGDLCIGGDVNTMLHAGKENVLPTTDAKKIEPVTWGIRGNFTTAHSHDFDLRSGSRIIVGGDFTIPTGTGNSFFGHNDTNYVNPSEIANKPIYIYINGDANFKSSVTLKNVYLFINGSASGTVEPSGSNNRIFMTDPSKGSGLTINNANGMTIEAWDWDEGATGKPGLSLKEALKALDKETETIAYPKWELAPSLTSAQHITINLNATNSAQTIGGTNLDANQGIYYIVHDENAESAKLLKSKGGNEQGVIGDKFVIDSINIKGESGKSRAIVIDTGDDPNNIVMLSVKGNYGDGKYFMWFPEEVSRDNASIRVVVLKGRGTVLVDLPTGVTYQNNESQYIMHYGWLTIAGVEEFTDNNHVQFRMGGGQNVQGGSKTISAKVAKYIHRECTSGDGCTYVREDTTEECTKPEHAGTMRKKIICISSTGSTMKEREYNGHGQVATYCPLCEPEKNSSSIDSSANWCANHTNKVELKNYYNTLTGTVKTRWQSAKTQRGEADPYGAVVYPTTNFFLVSCDEAADIKVSSSKSVEVEYDWTAPWEPTNWPPIKATHEVVKQTNYSPMFGFIYAPYMMFPAAQTPDDGVIKLCGGMIVSDYNINACDVYIGCYPEMMPKQLAGIGGGVISGNLGGAVKSWKLQLM